MTSGRLTIYIEGILAGTDTLQLYTVSGGQPAAQPANTLQIVAFQISGAQDVPGTASDVFDAAVNGTPPRNGSLYQYTVTGGNLPKDSAFGLVNGGIVVSGNAKSDNVLWGPVATVGQIAFQAASNFVWNYNVNVVDVEVQNPQIVPNPKNTSISQAGTGNGISSGSPAMGASATIDVIAPTVNGKERGAEFIVGGFIQNVTVGAYTAIYTANSAIVNKVTGQPDKLFVAAITPDAFKNPGPFLDMVNITLAKNGKITPVRKQFFVTPWYDSQLYTAKLPPGTFTGTQAPASSPKTIKISDAPFYPLPALSGNFPLSTGFGLGSGFLSVEDVKLNFSLFVAATTTDSTAIENKKMQSVYTAYAWGKWTFDGSGTIDTKGNWTPFLKATPLGPAGSIVVGGSNITVGPTGNARTMQMTTDVTMADVMITGGKIYNNIANGR